jgi:hypothetical protein
VDRKLHHGRPDRGFDERPQRGVALGSWWAAGIAFAIGFGLRVLALYRGWEEPLAKEPAGVYVHDDGRPLLGRKLKGKSRRELRDLGLTVPGTDAEPATQTERR